MKKNIVTLAVAAVLVIALTAFQSCKKDDLSNDNNKKAVTSTFNQHEIENMDEYLMNFMKKINKATRDSEPMLLADAEWHLSACLNFKYCDAGVEKMQVTYDTVYTAIQINNEGYVSLYDINISLQEISEEVTSVYQASELENKNILFIKPEIIDDDLSRSGATVRTVIAMSDRYEFGYYYFDNDSIPLSLFPDGYTYHWSTDAIDTLSYYINVFEPKKEEIPGRTYFVNLRTITCNYENCPGRLFGTKYSIHYSLTKEEMAYYLDSYLGLIIEMCPIGLEYISFLLIPVTGDYRDSQAYRHWLYITYGTVITSAVQPEFPGIQ